MFRILLCVATLALASCATVDPETEARERERAQAARDRYWQIQEAQRLPRTTNEKP